MVQRGLQDIRTAARPKGPSSLEIWICFEPLELTVSGPSVRLAMLGKVDMIVLLCVLVCFALAERAELNLKS